jgi:hypothetical protein
MTWSPRRASRRRDALRKGSPGRRTILGVAEA